MKAQFYRFTSVIEDGITNKQEYLIHICELLGCDESKVDMTESDGELHSFVGNRMILTHSNRIFYSLVKNASEYVLDSFQKYYTSKVVKREICRMMKCSSFLTLDELIGRFGNNAQDLINLIYLNLIIKESDCFNYGKEVNNICFLLDASQHQPQRLTAKEVKAPLGTAGAIAAAIAAGRGMSATRDIKTKPKMISYFRVIKGNHYQFKFNNNGIEIVSQVSFKYKNYSWVRVLFEKEVYLHLLQRYGNTVITNLVNRKFRNNPSYNKLSLLLKDQLFTITIIELREKKRFQLRVGLDFKLFIFDTLEEAYEKLSVM